MSEAVSFRSHVKTIEDLRGPAGTLEALLNTGRENAVYAVVVAHPHPLGGGTMHNKVVYHTAKAFSSFGLPVLRFNFRGTGLSEGTHDEGRGEVDDVRAALDWLMLFRSSSRAFRSGRMSAFGPAAATSACAEWWAWGCRSMLRGAITRMSFCASAALSRSCSSAETTTSSARRERWNPCW
jgi:alpha/beta superfamily hydrolase